MKRPIAPRGTGMWPQVLNISRSPPQLEVSMGAFLMLHVWCVKDSLWDDKFIDVEGIDSCHCFCCHSH